MPTVIADTGPLHYLVLIDSIELLPRLFGHVLMPDSVAAELVRPSTPAAVRNWIMAAPPWLERHSVTPEGAFPPRLGAGERAAITLARIANADLLLVDDRAAIAEARARGFRATGTLGVLERAAQLGLIDLPVALGRLKATNFRYRPELLARLIANLKSQHQGGSQ